MQGRTRVYNPMIEILKLSNKNLFLGLIIFPPPPPLIIRPFTIPPELEGGYFNQFGIYGI